RSFDLTMPEEINRMVTDAIADYFFTTSEIANENLRKAGIGEDRIFFVGNTMIDSLMTSLDKLSEPEAWSALQLRDKQYVGVTLHRPASVDHPQPLRRLLSAVERAAAGTTIVFPVHPRPRKHFELLKKEFSTIRDIEPL